jgi:hypothetical protein
MVVDSSGLTSPVGGAGAGRDSGVDGEGGDGDFVDLGGAYSWRTWIAAGARIRRPSSFIRRRRKPPPTWPSFGRSTMLTAPARHPDSSAASSK